MQTFLIYLSFYLILFLIGASLGSFSLVVVSRRIKKENWVKGRSKCDNCSQELSWWELFPVVNYIILRGKCRYCGKKIGIENFLVEIIFGLFAVFFWKLYGTNIIQYALMIVFFMLSAMAVMEDIKTQEIDDVYVIPGFLIGILATIIGIENFNLLSFLKQFAFNILIWPGLITLIILMTKIIIHKEGMGWGDVTTALMFTGILAPKQLIFAIFLSFFFGGIFAIYLKIFKKKEGEDAFAFGPFIVLASYTSLFFGLQFINWWLGLFHLL